MRLFLIFIIFLTIIHTVQSSVHSSFTIRRGLSSCILTASSLSMRRTFTGCREENRTRACLTASGRTTNMSHATPFLNSVWAILKSFLLLSGDARPPPPSPPGDGRGNTGMVGMCGVYTGFNAWNGGGGGDLPELTAAKPCDILRSAQLTQTWREGGTTHRFLPLPPPLSLPYLIPCPVFSLFFTPIRQPPIDPPLNANMISQNLITQHFFFKNSVIA
jgi:hypothetical protein